MDAFRPHVLALKLLGTVLSLWLVALVALLAYAQMDETEAGTAIVFYPPGWETDVALAASHQAAARLVTTTAFDNILVVASDDAGLVGRLKQHGALMAFRNLSIGEISFAGCLGGSL
jgi:hypothetical protein